MLLSARPIADRKGACLQEVDLVDDADRQTGRHQHREGAFPEQTEGLGECESAFDPVPPRRSVGQPKRQ